MSEFQFYDFRCIDKPLTENERREVNSWSSRSNASSHRATFTYAYGDFGKTPLDCVARYFDAMFYTANWGTRHLIFRFPQKMVDFKVLQAYNIDAGAATGYTSGISVSKQGEYVLLEFELCEDDYSEWIDEKDDTLSDLLPLREDILRGDYRSLFVFWLSMTQLMYADEMAENDDDFEDEIDDESETLAMPPIPANLKKLSSALSDFIDLYDINRDLITAAATFSVEPSKSETFSMEKALKNMSEKEKDAWLTRLFDGETRLDVAFKKHLESKQPQPKNVNNSAASFADIVALIGDKKNERQEREAIDRANAHLKKMNELVKKEADLWKTIYFNLDRKTGSAYDIAADALKDLYDVAVFFEKKNVFLEKLYDVEERYGRSKTLVERLKKKGLPLKNI
jgi:hypothetical protein